MKIEKLKKEEYLKFYNSLKNAKESNERGCYLSLEDPDHYKDTLNFILEDGVGGFAIARGGDLIAVHKNPALAEKKGVKKVLHEIMLVALVNSAIKLDCYGESLVKTYMKYGFIPVAKMKFSREYNADFPQQFGEPDVYAMYRPNLTLEELNKMMEDDSFVKFDEINSTLHYFEDYDAMLEYRDSLLEEAYKNNLSYNEIVNQVMNDENSLRRDC